MSDAPEGLRERTRRAVRDELAIAALGLFLEQGFEATTTEQIAEVAGVSRRSFFRYFASKDDVLAHFLTLPGEQLARNLEARDAAEPVWTALRRSMDPLIASMSTDPRALAMTRLMLEGDALRASHVHKQSRWRTALSLALAPRLPATMSGSARTVAADALSGAAIAALTAAESEWVATEGAQPLDALVDQAMGAISPVA